MWMIKWLYKQQFWFICWLIHAKHVLKNMYLWESKITWLSSLKNFCQMFHCRNGTHSPWNAKGNVFRSVGEHLGPLGRPGTVSACWRGTSAKGVRVRSSWEYRCVSCLCFHYRYYLYVRKKYLRNSSVFLLVSTVFSASTRFEFYILLIMWETGKIPYFLYYMMY